MIRKQPPGGVELSLKSAAGHSVLVDPKFMQGTFEIKCVRGDNACAVALNRSELAAFHAAIGELLEFYRHDGTEDPG